MNLPEIPAQALEMGALPIGLDNWPRSDGCPFCTRNVASLPCPDHLAKAVIDAAWPLLYAAALRHLADTVESDDDNYYDSMAGFNSITPYGLRELADEALKPVT
jgi:hypothetical protein